MTSQPDSVRRAGRYAAYVGLAIAVIALPLMLTSDSGCRFAGTATQDYEGYISEPGGTAGFLSFTLAPLLAIAALVLLARAGRPASLIAVAAALVVFPLALLDFILWAAKGAFACGLGLSPQ